MKTQIDSNDAFAAAIDQCGNALAAADSKTREAKALKHLLKDYAVANGIGERVTPRFKFRLVEGDASLRLIKDVSESDALKLMGKDQTMRAFIHLTYDSDAIKEHAATLDDPAAFLAKFGLYLTETKPKVSVECRKGVAESGARSRRAHGKPSAGQARTLGRPGANAR